MLLIRLLVDCWWKKSMEKCPRTLKTIKYELTYALRGPTSPLSVAQVDKSPPQCNVMWAACTTDGSAPLSAPRSRPAGLGESLMWGGRRERWGEEEREGGGRGAAERPCRRPGPQGHPGGVLGSFWENRFFEILKKIGVDPPPHLSPVRRHVSWVLKLVHPPCSFLSAKVYIFNKTRLILSRCIFMTSRVVRSIRSAIWALDHKKKSSKNIQNEKS